MITTQPRRHDHHPAHGTLDRGPGAGLPDWWRFPYVPGARAICGHCGATIVFVQGYELRRDYWRAIVSRPA